jgi:hypothetical protein
VGACCLVAGVLLPVAHVVASAPNAADQAAAFATLALAPLSGRGLVLLSQRLFRLVPAALILALALLPASSRSLAKFHEWADVSDVLADLRAHPQTGRHLTDAPDVFAFYAPQTAWDSSDGLSGQGRNGMRDAIDSRRYAVVVLSSTGGVSADHDRLLATLRLSPDYELDDLPRPADPAAAKWLVYRLVTVSA